MKRRFTILTAALALLLSLAIPMGMWGQSKANITDHMTASVLPATNTNYTAFNGVSLTSDAVYAGKSAKSTNGAIQLRSSGSDCGIVSTTSGGKIKSVKITVESGNKTIDVYGNNTAYTNANDLYATSGNSNQGTKLGSLTSTGTITVSGDYAYVGVRSNSGAVYISDIEFTWDNTGAPTPTTPCDIALTGAPVSLSFDLFNNTTEQVIHYTTSSTGTVYVESNDYVNATVDQDAKTITVTPKTIITSSAQTITVRQNADLTYLAGSVQFTVNITDSTPEPTYIFNTPEGLAALNIAEPASNAGTNLEENHNYNSGDVTMTITHGTTETRVWGGTSATDLRVYGGGGSLTFSVPSGQQITRIILVGEDPGKFNELGSKAEKTATWMGTPNRTVTLTANNTCKINTITVVYETNASGVDAPEMPASCNFVDEMEVAITCVTPGATIYYTTDGSDPNTSSTQYSAPFTIDATTTVKAVAYLNSNYSVVIEATYTLVYNITIVQATGGTIAASAAQAAQGTEITLTATPNVGYSFGSWTVTSSSGSVTVSTDNKFSMPASNVTVTASFTASNTAYTISFSVNNKIEMTATVYDGGSIDLTKFVAEGNGYTFEGWSTVDGGTNITPQNAYRPDADITLYPGVNPAPTGDEYTLVTNASQLEAGNLVVIAAHGETNLAMSTTQGGNNRPATSNVTKSAQPWTYISVNDTDVCEFELRTGSTSGTWAFYDANYEGTGFTGGYLYAASSSSNYLRTQQNLDANASWSISFEDGNATVTAQGSNTRNILRRNGSLFACYSSGQQPVFLYTKSASKSARGNRTVPTTSKITGIDATVKVTVKNNGIVYLTGTNAGNTSNLVVEDGGQLISTNNVEGTMLKSVTGFVTNNNKGHYYFISSPFTSATSPMNVRYMINTAGYDLYYFDQTRELEWITYKEGGEAYNPGFNLVSGKGYLYANIEAKSLEFAGTLRKGVNNNEMNTYTNYTLVYDSNAEFAGWNLVGNPFTSNVTVSKAFYKMNNTSDGVNTTAVVAGGMIAPMEGVFVLAENADDKNVVFTVNPTTPNKSRSVNVNVAREGEFLDRAIVTMGEGRLLNKLYLSENTTTISIPQDGNDYAIVPSNGQNEMPVSFKASRNANYTISIDAENVEMNYLHLIDNMTGADVDLLQTPSYNFEAKTTDYESRFKLVFATGDNSNDDNFAFFSNGSFVINNDGAATLQVIDVTGRILSSESINGCTNVNVNAASGVYMLRLINGDNVKVQKVVVK